MPPEKQQNVEQPVYGPPEIPRAPVNPEQNDAEKAARKAMEEFEKGQEIFHVEKMFETDEDDTDGKQDVPAPTPENGTAPVEQPKTAMDKMADFFGNLGKKLGEFFEKMSSGTMKMLLRFAELTGFAWAADILRPMVEPKEIREAMKAKMPDAIINSTPEDGGYARQLREQYERKLTAKNLQRDAYTFETFYKEKIDLVIKESGETKGKTFTLASVVQTGQEAAEQEVQLGADAKLLEEAGAVKTGETNAEWSKSGQFGGGIMKVDFIHTAADGWQWRWNEQEKFHGKPMDLEEKNLTQEQIAARTALNDLQLKLKMKNASQPEGKEKPKEKQESPEAKNKRGMIALIDAFNGVTEIADPVSYEEADTATDLSERFIAALSAGDYSALSFQLDGSVLEATDEGWLNMGHSNLIDDWASSLKLDPARAIREFMAIKTEGFDEQSGKSIAAIKSALRKSVPDLVKNEDKKSPKPAPVTTGNNTGGAEFHI